MLSMTGFGRAEQSTRLGTVIVELSGVNNRFLEVTVRAQRQFAALESRLREQVTAHVTRGQVTVLVLVDENAEAAGMYRLNEAAIAAYLKQMRALSKKYKIDNDVTWEELIVIPDVVKADRERLDLDELWKLVHKPFETAMNQMLAMRRKEGQAMHRDMKARLAAMQKTVQQVKKMSGNAVVTYRDKLTARIDELLPSSQRGNLRLEEEVAIFAERTDVHEECTRLGSHVEQYRTALEATEPIGKRLNFILQEMNREANTIGSKSADLGITRQAISLKEEIEKLREMAQNVE